jgi:signal-transduction protein with cAMP-binding, CBS, and nucleotidyltransferase domain
MEKSLLEFLLSNPLFKSLSVSELETISEYFSEEIIEEASYVFLESEEANHFYILREGILRASIGGKLLTNIQPGEYFGEIAVLNKSIRSGSVYALEKSKVVCIDGNAVFWSGKVPVEISFKLLKELIRKLTSLHYTNDFYKRTSDIIRQGEGEKVEFKSTLRFNIHSGKFGREIEHAALKSIAAFLNSWGGILLIGVDNEGNVTGIEKDLFENDDRALLHLTAMIKERIGTHHMQFINSSIEQFDTGKVMRIDVSPSNLPAYLVNNNEEYFYVRTGPATTDLKPSQIFDYIDNRFFRPRG